MNKIMMMAALAASLVFGSCSKDKAEPSGNSNGNTTNKTPQELLVGTWQTSSVVWNGQEAIEDCQKDNLITFKADGSYTTDQGAIKCNPNASQTAQGQWEMDNYPSFTTTLNVNPQGTTVTIKTLDNTTLSYEQTETGQTYLVTWTKK